MARIYISSTNSYLDSFRRAISDALKQLGFDVDGVAEHRDPLDRRLRLVTECDIFIGIVAWKYGRVPPGQKLSIPELEYRAAGQCGAVRLMFVLDQNAPWPPSEIEGGEGAEKLRKWRSEMVAAYVIPFQSSDPNDLVLKVVAAVSEWSREQLQRTMSESEQHRITSSGAHRIRNVINVRPLDVVETFKGRERETDALFSYLAEPSVHMVSVLGRGGMGKTALATRVLADLESGLLGDRVVDGIVYLAAKNMPITLERIYADVARMFDDDIASTLAMRWSNPVISMRAKADYLIEAMSDGLYIILLDNLEHLLKADGSIEDESLRVFVEQCLIEPSAVRLVVTSRQKIKVPSSGLRATRTITLEAGLEENEAIALLKDLDPQGELGIRDASEELLRRAIQLTNGIPRALELLSGLLYDDPTTELEMLLSDRRLFGSEVMGPLVAAGYQHLKEPHRRLMEALAVFNKQVNENAIGFLVEPWMPGFDVHAGLKQLLNGRFVQYNSETRSYSLHQLDRDYAYEQIPAASAGLAG